MSALNSHPANPAHLRIKKIIKKNAQSRLTISFYITKYRETKIELKSD